MADTPPTWAGRQVTDLTTLTGVADGDWVPIYDVSAPGLKKIAASQIVSAVKYSTLAAMKNATGLSTGTVAVVADGTARSGWFQLMENAPSEAAGDYQGVELSYAGDPWLHWHRIYDGPINAKWFGAKGDVPFSYWRNQTWSTISGTTDDTEALQAAIDYCLATAAGKLYIPPGVYRITSSLECALYSLDIIGAGDGHSHNHLISDGTDDDAINALRVKTVLLRHVPVQAATISDYFPVLIYRGANSEAEYTLLTDEDITPSPTYLSPQNKVYGGRVSGIVFSDVRSGSDYTVPSYDGVTHFPAMLEVWYRTHTALEYCLFDCRGPAIEAWKNDDGRIRFNFFTAGLAYNGSSAYANSTGAIVLHRTDGATYDTINTLYIEDNFFEGCYCQDIYAGMDGTETGDISGLIIRRNNFKRGGQGNYLRTRRFSFNRLEACRLELGGLFDNTDAGDALAITEGAYLEEVDNSEVYLETLGAFSTASVGVASVDYCARFVNCKSTRITYKDDPYAAIDGTKFATDYLIYLDKDSIDEGTTVEDYNTRFLSGIPAPLCVMQTSEHGDREAYKKHILKHEGWFTFDKTNDNALSLQTDSKAQMGTGDFTICMLMFVPTSVSGVQGLFGTSTTGGTNMDGGLVHGLHMNGISFNWLAPTVGATRLEEAGFFATFGNAWRWVTITRAGTMIRFFLDDYLYYEGTDEDFDQSFLDATYDSIYIGVETLATETFVGRIAKAVLLNDALTLPELIQLIGHGPTDDQILGGNEVALTSGSLIAGGRYEIVDNTGLTATTAGAADNNVGTQFIANGGAVTWGSGSIKRIGILLDVVPSTAGAAIDAGPHSYTVTVSSGCTPRPGLLKRI